MGSVKDLIRDDSPGGRLYIPPTAMDFGRGAWQVSGRFSVGDLKELIPDTEIKDKAEALTMMVAHFFEWLEESYPQIKTCYQGLLDKNGRIKDSRTLLDMGETSNTIVMELAHTPGSYSDGDLEKYRQALTSGELQCGVADIESIFRHGFPLGSSTFKRIFESVGMGGVYAELATYDDTVEGLDHIRAQVAQWGVSKFPDLERILKFSGLGTQIPNPGFVLKGMTYDTTTKFESAGDREIQEDEAFRYSGLDRAGFEYWTTQLFPVMSQAQIVFADDRGLMNMDGKAECVAYRRKPVITDFACSPDENRLMLTIDIDGVTWAIPSNKEIQRAIFKREGVDAAKYEAIQRAGKAGDETQWKAYLTGVLQERGIDIREVAEHSCNLMSYAIGEVANRILGQNVFDAKPLETWVDEFLLYASKLEYQEEAQ
ncbi:MAG: hypothetical protein KKG59_00400 [Nanoarchaeota archaeon]|nr:hypothetical protein [Nanoarchaeota archaeon]